MERSRRHRSRHLHQRRVHQTFNLQIDSQNRALRSAPRSSRSFLKRRLLLALVSRRLMVQQLHKELVKRQLASKPNLKMTKACKNLALAKMLPRKIRLRIKRRNPKKPTIQTDNTNLPSNRSVTFKEAYGYESLQTELLRFFSQLL